MLAQHFLLASPQQDGEGEEDLDDARSSALEGGASRSGPARVIEVLGVNASFGITGLCIPNGHELCCKRLFIIT